MNNNKSVLVINTPTSCKDCAIVCGKACPALEHVDLSPCKSLGIRHKKCPLIPYPETIGQYFVFNERVWEMENEAD